MIVREMPNGQLLCINQTSHALLAAAFCRRWGNRDFSSPAPYEIVMMAIAQHDCGWYEWDSRPCLRDDGYPMDFLHGPTGTEKLTLWRRGIERVAAQHPYASLLVGQHAAIMHEEAMPLIPMEERLLTQVFIDEQRARIHTARQTLDRNSPCARALDSPAFEAHTRLLQFGDTVSLQVTMPWGPERVFDVCPIDSDGNTTTIYMTHRDGVVSFNPWPFAVDAFEVSIHGKLLGERNFATVDAYRSALSDAHYHRLVWTVERSI